jgi:hypothetical protein
VKLWLVWTGLLTSIGLGSYAAIDLGIQLLITILSMVVLPVPVGMTTGKMSRTILAGFLPLLCMVAAFSVSREPGMNGQLSFILLILPVACANALCPPPYRLSILLAQTFWVWYEAWLFFHRGYLELPWTLGLAVLGPLIFLVTAMMGRAVPVESVLAEDARRI